jgi:Domain of unknown function (DUF4432)
MPDLYGQTFTREDLLQHTGNLSQVAGVRLSELADGFERGVRALDFNTGSGLAFTVLADRGMDIGAAAFQGAALAWHSAAPHAAPAFYDAAGNGWLRGFAGGLVVTCGLTHYGAAGPDGEEMLGIHGPASYIPATHVAYGGDWQDGFYTLWCSGEVRQAGALRENLVLRRRITTWLGESRLHIDDTVTNEGFQATPLMLLYHCNFGFPLLSADSEMIVRSRVAPRDPDAARGLSDCLRFQPPTPGYREQVFYHTLVADPEGYAEVRLANRRFAGGRGLGVGLRFRVAELPCLNEWKMMQPGNYVCGLEPGTNWVGGRAEERAAGRLRLLEPGASAHFGLDIRVLASHTEIDGGS